EGFLVLDDAHQSFLQAASMAALALAVSAGSCFSSRALRLPVPVSRIVVSPPSRKVAQLARPLWQRSSFFPGGRFPSAFAARGAWRASMRDFAGGTFSTGAFGAAAGAGPGGGALSSLLSALAGGWSV